MKKNKFTKSKNKPQSKRIKNKKSNFLVRLWFKTLPTMVQLRSRPLGTILTLSVICISLTIPTFFYLVGKNIIVASSNMNTSVQVNVYLREDITPTRAAILKDEIEQLADVKEAIYISSQEGLDDLSSYSGFDQALNVLNKYTLPALLVITPLADDRLVIDNITDHLNNLPEVTDIRFDEEWLSKLGAMQTLSVTLVSIFSLLMLSSIFLTIGNTLRFNALVNKDEIQTMKLIGATDGYILRPYLYSGMWFGLLSSLAALLITFLSVLILNHSIKGLSSLYDSPFRLFGLSVYESLTLILIGTLLGSIAAQVSAKKHLQEIGPI